MAYNQKFYIFFVSVYHPLQMQLASRKGCGAARSGALPAAVAAKRAISAWVARQLLFFLNNRPAMFFDKNIPRHPASGIDALS